MFASASAVPGNYTLTLTGTSGGISQSLPLQVRVVQNLVYLQVQNYNFAFIPVRLAVTTGATVYFYNADPAHTWCGAYDTGAKSIMFTTMISTTSPDINTFGLWSITLTAPGSYTYFDTYHPSIGNGTIIVSG